MRRTLSPHLLPLLLLLLSVSACSGGSDNNDPRDLSSDSASDLVQDSLAGDTRVSDLMEDQETVLEDGDLPGDLKESDADILWEPEVWICHTIEDCLGREEANPCLKVSCVDSECVWDMHALDGQACDDGDSCTQDDSCLNSICRGNDICVDCTDDGDCAGLNDDDLCNGTLRCDLSRETPKCMVDAASIIVCEEENPCIPMACVPETGECIVSGDREGEACDDGDPCTGTDLCTAGECLGEPFCYEGFECSEGLCLDPFEPDNTPEQASWQDAGTSVAHSLAGLQDRDWVVFNVPQRSQVTITLSGTELTPILHKADPTGVEALEFQEEDGSLVLSGELESGPRLLEVLGPDDLIVPLYFIDIQISELSCVPSCDGLSCGDDGCGGTCGACQGNRICDQAGQCAVPPLCSGWTCDPGLFGDGQTCDCGCGCWDVDCNLPDLTRTGCEAGTVCVESGTCRAEGEWTIAVFLNADNDLEEYGLEDLVEMQDVVLPDGVELVVLLDTYEGEAELAEISTSGYHTLQDKGELDMSDWRVLRDFGLWVVRNRPARHYGFIMWDHGEGWRAPTEPDRIFKAFSNDEHGTAEEISVARGDLTAALEPVVQYLGRPIDLLGFDACLMGMWEVAEVVRPQAEIMVASEETEPGEGWIYSGFLQALVDNPQLSPEDLAMAIVQSYHDESTDNSTLAALDLRQLDELTARLSVLATLLSENPDQFQTLAHIRAITQSFDVDFWSMDQESDYKDLKHFAHLVAVNPDLSEEVRAAAQELDAALDQVVMLSLSQGDFPNANGLSIYFPPRSYCLQDLYTLDTAIWSQRSTWDDFLAAFTSGDCGEWTCDPSYFNGGDGCDCDCGAWDPDCDDPMQETYGCELGQWCITPGLCLGTPVGICEGWTCDDTYFGAGDGCDCDCGCWDIDCNDPHQEVYNCEHWESCVEPGICQG